MKNFAEEIIERIKQAESLRYDTDVAIALGAEKQHVGPWKARGQIPWERVLDYARKSGVSLDYLVLGRGPVRVAGICIGEDAEHYGLTEIDKAILTKVITTIDEVFDAKGLECSGKRKAQLITLIYRSCVRAQGREPDRQEIEELIELSITEQ
ncbi:MAG: helix-turn-helix domain-containing protein [Thiotrichaceae bacterium]|nr:helix-turn-helix domain-containing protein [Thiotrichaceae bacterium]